MRFDDKEKTILRDFGELPLLARKAKSVLRIENAPKSMKLYARNSDGSRRAEIGLEYKNGAAQAELSTELDGKAVFAYELVVNRTKTAPIWSKRSGIWQISKRNF